MGALSRGSLTDFEVEEQLSWANHRDMKRQEDKAYSTLGIFSIHMPLLYGEGGKCIRAAADQDRQVVRTEVGFIRRNYTLHST
jgi:hypothetical protein